MRLSLALALLLAVGCRTASPVPRSDAQGASPAAPSASAFKRITLVGTNDWHGWVTPHEHVLPDGATVNEGGAATFAGYVRILRAQNPGGVLLLDGGDLFQGTLPVNLSEGRVIVDVFNRLGVHAAALGNHEFDYGPVGAVSVATQADHDPFGALKERLKEARFGLLAVNVYDAQTGQRPAWFGNDGTMLLEVHGVKIGLFGLVTPTTPQTTNPVNVASLRFGSLVPEAAGAAQRLRERGADLVIALAHAGGKCPQWKNPVDVSGCEAGGEIFEMLQALPPRTLDAVIAGHTHQPLGHFVNETPVIESNGLGRSFGVIELAIDSHGRLRRDQTVIEPSVPVCERVDPKTQACNGKDASPAAQWVPARYRGQPVQSDPAIAAALRPYLEAAAAEQQRPLGLQVPVRLGRHYENESDLGRLITESLRKMENADVALMNSGGLRADLPAGELTYGRLYEVLPFDNTIATVTLSGEELDRLLHAAYGARKGVFQISGLKVTLAECPSKDRLRAYALENGARVLPSGKYKVVMPDFLARGGDGLGAVLSSLPPGRMDLGAARPLNLRDALTAYWRKAGKPLAAPQTRHIAFVADPACPAAASRAP